MKKFTVCLLIGAMAASMLTGCGSNGGSSDSSDSKADSSSETMTIMMNGSDSDAFMEGYRKIVDGFNESNEYGVKVEIQNITNADYKTKLTTMMASDSEPDIIFTWPLGYLENFVNGDKVVSIQKYLDEDEDWKNSFNGGILDPLTYDGEVYAIPTQQSTAIMYYNKAIFDKYGLEVPTTYDELLDLAGKMNDAGITPLAMDGGDGWPMAVYLSDILFKLTGSDYSQTVSDAIANKDFSDPNIKKAVELLKKSADAGLFQKGYDSQDYATAQNLFTNGQAAMYYMGSWDASMALNEDIPEDIRTNIRMFTMPVIDGGKGTATDIAAWNGGGYAVSATSSVKDEAIKFLNYMYQPDQLSKIGWENGVGMSAQDQSAYMTGDETDLQMQFVDAVNNATSVSGTPINDCGPSAFKTCIESEIQNVSNGGTSIDDFLATIGSSCDW